MWRLWITAILSFLTFALYFCTVDNEGDETSNGDLLDDDTYDGMDDDLDDDQLDDDVSDDDVAPVISDAYFEPNPTEIQEGEEEDYWYSMITFNICDEDNDLLPAGSVQVWYPSTFEPPPILFDMTEAIIWPGGDLGQAGDCDDPVRIGFEMNYFGTVSDPAPPLEACFYVWAYDNTNLESNILGPVCVTHNPVPE